MRVADERIIAALLQHSTNREAAESVGLTEAQLYNRMKSEPFKAKLSEAKAKVLQAAAASASGRIGEALAVMLDVMSNTKNAPQIRLNAADGVLRNSLRLIDAADVQARIERLELMLEEMKNARN